MNVAELREMTARLVVGPMIEYLEEFEGDEYTRADVEQCEALINTYLDALDALTPISDAAIMEQVKILVLALNDLNEATDYGLIETEAREAIWEVVQTAAVSRGLVDVPDDVTEQWRDW